jgi:serine phosphatase RsbU (regulator of sigma subunit)/Tfp pilus assembly protein PilF
MRNLFLATLFFVSTFSFSQNIDSLKLVLKNAKHDTTRAYVFLVWGEEIYLQQPETALVLWQKGKELAEKNLAKLPNTHPQYKVFNNCLASALNNIGFIYQSRGDIPKALDYWGKCLKILEKIGDKEGIANSLNSIGYIYKLQGDIPKALDYYIKSVKILEEVGYKKGIVASLNNIAIVYQSQGDFPKALDYYNKGLKIGEESGDKVGMANSLNNLGFIYHEMGDIPKAMENWSKSLKIREENEDKKGVAISLNNIGNIYLEQKNYTKAMEFCSKSMNISKELGYPEYIRNSAKALSKIYKATGKYQLAFEYYELFIQMRDSINNQENRKASYKSQIKYDFEKQALTDSLKFVKEKEVKQKEIEKQKVEIEAKRNQQYALFGGLALVIIFAGFMFNRFKITQKQKAVIEQQKIIVEQQKHIVEEKHKEITDSINYAERIQRSFIATKEILDENLNDYFVLFKPKDVVSGDFYWASKLNNGNFALATADSTGHGVPGAIMSLLNITSLEKAIETHLEPSDILNSTRKTIIERLKKDGSEHGGKDGMDASLTVYDFKNKKIFIAAANNPVWIMRGSEVIDIKPDKMPIGKGERDTILFTQQEIDLQKGDVVYTLTDGFPDQFGGEKGKKFMSKNLRELLAVNSNLSMHEQKQLLEKTFANWVGDLEQVDDVTIIGVRV